MNDPVAWENLSGEMVEELLAILISRERPNANHIRPASGDYGRDVEVKNDDGTIDVYQIKKFSANLSSGQKRQIEDSWNRFNEYLRQSGARISHWYLMMPLNPTPNNLEWFNSLTAESSIQATWLDKTYIRMLESKYPEVVDFYQNGGRERREEIIRDAFQTFSNTNEGSADAIVLKLQKLQTLLNKLDPHYNYDLHLVSAMGSGVPAVINPKAVCTTWEIEPDGTAIAIGIVPKYIGAPLLEPIKTTIHFDPQNEDQRGKVESFFTYGTALKDVPVRITGVSPQLAVLKDPLSAKAATATCTLWSIPKKEPVDLVLTCGTSSVRIHNEERTSGMRGGIHWSGKDASGLLSMDMFISPERGVQYTFTFHGEDLGGQAIDDVRYVSDFCKALQSNSTFSVETMDGDLIQTIDGTVNNFREAMNSPLLFKTTEILSELQHFTNSIIHLPHGIEQSEIRDWWMVLNVLKRPNVLIFIPWDEQRLTLKDDADMGEVDFPCGICGIHKLSAVIDDESIFFGYCQWWANAGSGEKSDKDCFVFKPDSSAGYNALMAVRHIVPSAEQRETSNELFIGPPIDFTQYRLNELI